MDQITPGMTYGLAVLAVGAYSIHLLLTRANGNPATTQVGSGKICHPAFSDFCNTICQKRSSASMRMMAANRGKHRRAQRNPCDALSRLSVITDGTEHVYRCGLFHSLEHQFNYPTTGPRRIAPLHFISGDRDRSWLRST